MEATAGTGRQRQREAERLLALTRAVALEAHPESPIDDSLGLDDSLDDDFGLESLARAELIRRVESESGVTLPEILLTSAETPRDLLFGVVRSHHHPGRASATPLHAVRQTEGVRHATSLVDVLLEHLDRRAGQTHIRLLSDDGEDDITYRDLDMLARRTAAGILGRGVREGSAIALMLPTSSDYFASFLGAIAAGCIPVPIYPPARPTQLEEHLTRHANILRNAGAELLITSDDSERAAQLLEQLVPSIRAIVTPDTLTACGEVPSFRARAGDDIAFLQYTSGSTGNPKGVVITHANVLANLRAAGAVMAPRNDDVIVSWLPLYHDMGLMAWLGSFYFALPLVSMSPLRFLSRPSRWLQTIHRFRGTLSAAPNFAYEMCATKIFDEELKGLDLSSWRLAFNGAETVSAETIRRFTKRFVPFGFRPSAMYPVYGLAESTVALAFPPSGREPWIERVDREKFVTDGVAVPTEDPAGLQFVGCGEPVPQHEVRVVGADDVELADRREGHIHFRGPSATRGYFDNEPETRRLLHGTWLDTGDLGYTVGREVFVTGRAKDVIIRAGRHVYPDELEQVVSGVSGVRRGCVAVFGSPDPAAQTERVVVVAETRVQEREQRTRIETAIRSAAADLSGVVPDEIVLVPPHAVLKTSSGKIRRQATRAAFESGVLTHPVPAWRQLLHLEKHTVRPRVRRGVRRLREIAYAWYALGSTMLLAPFIWLAVVLAPGLARRRAMAARFARMLLSVLRVPVVVTGAAPLGTAVYVANHASYLDGAVLPAVLPRDVAYVVKKEFVRRFYSRTFFSRIGVHFVERFDPRLSLQDSTRLAQIAASGQSLVIFPEATFSRGPGLLPFRMGAFLTAAQAGVPVVPVTLRGTRAYMRGDDWFPRLGGVEVVIGEPIVPSGKTWAAAVELHKRVRAEILAHCGEADLEPVEKRSRIEKGE